MRADAPGPVLALRLTAMTLLLRPIGPPGIRAAILILATLALLTPRVLLSPIAWFALASLIAARIAMDWPLADNHVYLLAYWCLAIALALGGPDPAAALTASGRLLLGLAFTMAVVWKAALSPDYLDGRFFRVTLLTDDRFADTVTLFGGLSRAELAYNRERLGALPEGAELLDPPPLVEPPAFRRLVWLSTVGALAMEALVALACVMSLAGTSTATVHALLLTFCLVTYAFAPVAGFGWLVLSIGAALCTSTERTLRAAYVTAWCLVLVYSEVPWAGVLLAIGARAT